MKNKVVYIGDPHFKHNNNDYVDEFIKTSLNVVEYNLPCLCVVAGDVLDTHEKLHQTPLNKAVRFLKKLATMCPTFVLVGNHDYVNNQQFLTDNHWMNCLKGSSENLYIVDRPTRSTDVLTEVPDLMFVPYVPPGRFVEALETKGGSWRDCVCIFAHQEFRGSNLGIVSSEHGDSWPIDFPQVVSGHIHKRHSPQDNILYPGSVIQHNFGEENNDGGVAILTFGKEMTAEYMRVDIPRMYSVNVAFEDLSLFLKNYKPRPLQRVRVLCAARPEQRKVFAKTINKNVPANVNVVFKEIRVVADNQRAGSVVPFNKILNEKLQQEGCNSAFQFIDTVNSFDEFVHRIF